MENGMPVMRCECFTCGHEFYEEVITSLDEVVVCPICDSTSTWNPTNLIRIEAEERTDCEFCCDVDLKPCTEEEVNGYRCSRKKGHTGDHVACGEVEHNLSRWTNKEEKE